MLNVGSENNFRLTARGISTNGYSAGLQTTTTIYLDELPISTIGNTVTLNPTLFDVERVEFLRGPQGTLFGSGSLSGALRILTHSPDLAHFDASALVDFGETPDGSGLRQRYNGMVNIPLVTDTLGLRVVGFYRNEDGYIDNVGTGVKNSNALRDRADAQSYCGADRTAQRSAVGFLRGQRSQGRLADKPVVRRPQALLYDPDLYTTITQIYNATVGYKFDGANLTSSTTYSISDNRFDVDLAGTFADTIPFYLQDGFRSRTFVQEPGLPLARRPVRLGGGRLLPAPRLQSMGRGAVESGIPCRPRYHRVTGRRHLHQFPQRHAYLRARRLR